MRISRAVLDGILIGCSLGFLSACGGGGGGSMTPAAAAITIAVQPTTITQGQSATLTWSSSTGTSCTASGAWSGPQAGSGTQSVSPTTIGANTYTLTCSGGVYSSNNASAVLTVNAASAFTKSNLVSSAAGMAVTTDVNLINPWGIVIAAGAPAWIANNGSNTSTVYDGTGTKLAPHPAIPTGMSGTGSPTGIVANGTTDFVITKGVATAASQFIFAGENGIIAGWANVVDPANAIIKYDDPNGAVFKGLAIANNGTANFLYAADFHNNKVLVFDNTFATTTVTGGFTDTTLPAGYAPFGIQTLQIGGQTRIVVTYAKQDATAHDHVAGAGLGLVNVFDANGTLIKHLIPVGGALNSPWGIALAPANFGTLSNQLLIGNFGDGIINAYDPATGQFAGALKDSTGNAIATSGLWGIAFGNGARNQPTTTLYFAAGISNEAGGLYGRIDLGATAPDIVAPTGVALTAPVASTTVTGTVPVTATATDNVGVTQVQFLAGTTVIGTATTTPFTINWNTNVTANGSVNLTAKATDAAGNTTTSAAVQVTVSNVAVNFSDLYTAIIASTGAAHCANCHTGGGASLPSSMNFSSAANAYAALVGVTSLEATTLQRVKAGDPNNSYLINKLEGTNLNGTARMPFGGPYLDQPTINMVRAWIAQGALNN